MRINLAPKGIAVLQDFVDAGYMSADVFRDLYTSKDLSSVLQVLRSTYNIDKVLADKLVLHVVYNMFDTPKNDSKLSTYFNEKEWAVFKFLLTGGGVRCRSLMYKWDFPARWRRAIDRLEEMGYVSVLPTIGSEVFVMLNMHFVMEVRE